jgi:Beta-lactamase enzyme family
VRRTRSAVVRRRRLAVTVAVVVAVAAVVVVAARLPLHSHRHGTSLTPPPGTAVVATSSPSHRTLHRALLSYIKHREGSVSVAVYDRVAKALTVVHPALRGRTASIVKVDILETLLHRAGGHLSEEQRETATSMIENSNNDSATDLWNQDGGAPGVAAYDSALGLQQTTPNVDWGLTTTSAADQVTLVRELLQPSSLLTDRSRRFQRRLMRHVEADQRWGISAGTPADATVGIKNGWLPVTEDDNRWAVNSIGWVNGGDKHYVIAVLTQHGPSEAYGIHTIEHLSRTAWSYMTAAKDKS